MEGSCLEKDNQKMSISSETSSVVLFAVCIFSMCAFFMYLVSMETPKEKIEREKTEAEIQAGAAQRDVVNATNDLTISLLKSYDELLGSYKLLHGAYGLLYDKANELTSSNDLMLQRINDLEQRLAKIDRPF